MGTPRLVPSKPWEKPMATMMYNDNPSIDKLGVLKISELTILIYAKMITPFLIGTQKQHFLTIGMDGHSNLHNFIFSL